MNYEIVDFDYYSNNKSDLLLEIKNKINEICDKKERKHLIKLLNIINNDTDYYCCIAYKSIIISKFELVNGDLCGIVIVKDKSPNNSMIINILTSTEKTSPKKIDRYLLDRIVDRAIDNDVKYIYMETKIEDKLFYDDNISIISGLLILPLIFNINIDCDTDDLDNNFVNNNINFILTKESFFNFELNIYKIKTKIASLKFSVTEITNGYKETEIEELEFYNFDLLEYSEDEIKEFLITIYDNICTNHYIYRSNVSKNIKENDIFITCNYTKPQFISNAKFVKKYNEFYFIDRNVLSY